MVVWSSKNVAAPDVDRDYFREVIPKVGKIVSGLTLYASSAHKAMVASRELGRAPRAGHVPADKGRLFRIKGGWSRVESDRYAPSVNWRRTSHLSFLFSGHSFV